MFAALAVLAIVGSVFAGFGLSLALLNVVSVVKNHTDPRSHSSHVFLAAGLSVFAGVFALRRFYPGWRNALVMFGAVVLAEALPLLVGALVLLRARLRGERLEGADLEAQDLTARNLRGARLRGANLRRANLRGADLREADLTDADLCGADLTGAFLGGATLDGARFDGADLRETEIHRVTGFERARYSHETLWPVEMDGSAIPSQPARSGTSSAGLS